MHKLNSSVSHEKKQKTMNGMQRTCNNAMRAAQYEAGMRGLKDILRTAMV
jgi:hypothetical protein